MAQFYASIQGSRGEATRMGTKSSGITGHIRGWDVGAQVSGYHDTERGDVFEVRATGGSNGSRSEIPVAIITRGNDGTLHIQTF